MPATALAAALPRVDAFAALCDNVHACTACPRMSHTHTITDANGPLDARVLFVAEAPGRRGAALTGVPLSGDESGRRFEHFLALAGLTRPEVFVTNAVLCNPLDPHSRNRTPTQREVANCHGFLAATFNLIQSPTVVVLGRVALKALAAIEPHDLSLTHAVACPTRWRNRTLIPLYHPGRQSTLHRSQQLQESDWLRLSTLIKAEDRLSPAT